MTGGRCGIGELFGATRDDALDHPAGDIRPKPVGFTNGCFPGRGMCVVDTLANFLIPQVAAEAPRSAL